LVIDKPTRITEHSTTLIDRFYTNIQHFSDFAVYDLSE